MKRTKQRPKRGYRRKAKTTTESYLTLKTLRAAVKSLKTATTQDTSSTRQYVVPPGWLDWGRLSDLDFETHADYTPALPFIQEFENPLMYINRLTRSVSIMESDFGGFTQQYFSEEYAQDDSGTSSEPSAEATSSPA